MLTLVFEMLAKHNEEVLVPVDDDGNKKNYFKGFPFERGTFKTLLMHLTNLVIKINLNCLNNSFWNRYKKLILKLS